MLDFQVCWTPRKKKKTTKKQVAVFLGQDQEEERGSVP